VKNGLNKAEQNAGSSARDPAWTFTRNPAYTEKWIANPPYSLIRYALTLTYRTAQYFNKLYAQQAFNDTINLILNELEITIIK